MTVTTAKVLREITLEEAQALHAIDPSLWYKKWVYVHHGIADSWAIWVKGGVYKDIGDTFGSPPVWDARNTHVLIEEEPQK